MVSKWFCILILLISNIFTHETIIAVDAQYQPAQQGDSKDGSGIASAELLFDGELETLEWIGKDDEVLLLLTTTKQVWRSGDNGMTWKMVTDDLKTLTNTAGGDPAYARLIASIQTNKNSQSSANPTNNNQQTTTAGISPNKPSPFGVVDIIVSEVDSDFVFLRGNGAHSYASINGGLNWYVSTIPSSQPDDLKTEFETVTPHPTNKNYLLATSLTLKCTKKKQGLSNCRRILWRSKDWGQNWEKMHDYIIQADWYYNIKEDKRNGEPEESILATISGKQSGDQKFGIWDKDVNLIKSDDGFRSTNIVLLGGNKFLFTDDFLFVARAEVGDKGVTLSLKISADGGKTFAHGKLPKEMQHAYTMLDSEDGAVFLHVNHQGSSLNYGNIYISDATGFNYTLSLAYNRRDADGKCDFEKVAGLEGIYIANYISNAQEIEDWEKESSKPASISNIKDQNPEESPFGNVQKQKHGFGIGSSAFSGEKMINKMDKTSKRISPKPKEKVKTVITHDRGGMWTVLRPPERDANGKPIDCSSSDCSLHLNGISGEWGPFYTAESATGLIMATGNVGPQLSKAAGEINTYFSRDAGLTWEEVRKGSRMYEFGDHGGIIVMADDVNPTESLEFSWTQGSSWSLHKFTNTGPLVIENIITEPSSTGAKFILYGTKKLPNGKSTGALYAVDFSKYHSRICQGVAQAGSASSDYELWSPHDGRYEDKCLLGHKLDITRRKRDAACFNPEEHERIVKQYDCPCAESDYECDYGYFRKVQGGPCVRDESITIDREGLIPDHCPPGSTYTISNGYRKIAGDTCIVEGGLNRVPSAFPCPGGVLGVSYNGWIVTFIVVSMIIMLVLTNAGGPKNRSAQKLSTINIFFGKALDLARRIVQLILFYGPRSWKDTYNRFTGSKYDYSDYNEVGKEGIEPESFYDDDREHANKKYKSEDPFDDAIDDMEAVEYKGDEPFSSSSKFQPLPKKVLPSQPVPLLSAPRAAQPVSISTAKKPVDQNQYQYTDINFDDLDAV